MRVVRRRQVGLHTIPELLLVVQGVGDLEFHFPDAKSAWSEVATNNAFQYLFDGFGKKLEVIKCGKHHQVSVTAL